MTDRQILVDFKINNRFTVKTLAVELEANPRTVRRWLSGRQKIPEGVMESISNHNDKWGDDISDTLIQHIKGQP